MEVICRRTTDPLNNIKKLLKKRRAESKPKVKSLKNSSLAVDEIPPKTDHKKRKIEVSSECSLMKKSKLDHCQGILTKLMKHKWSVPFLHPVDPDAAGDYFRVVKHPMDFATIKRKIQENKYLNDDEFAADVRLIFSNATLYHPSNNWVHLYATKLSRVFDILWLPVKPKLVEEPILEQNNGDGSTCIAKEIGLEIEPDYSLLRAARIANLKARFSDTILRAKTKTGNELENKSKIEAETKTTKVATQTNSEDEYQLKRQREHERAAARASLEQMERSITLDDNQGAMRELEALMRSNQGNEACDGSWIQSKPGRRRSPLERLGLFIKQEYRLGYEDDDDLFIQGADLEEGEILV